ncbi:MAG: bifunctional DNA primase/polymerase [bacterium]
MLTQSKIKIPEQLKNKGLAFVKLKGKRPIEQEWTKKPYTDIEIEQYLVESPSNNYGILCGHNNLIVIDIDNSELAEELKDELPSTFIVKTSRGYHFYYFCPDIRKKITLKKGSVSYGEILSTGQQAVAPNSIHPDTKKVYLPINNNEIAHTTYADICSFLSEYIELDYPETNKFEQDTLLKIEDVLEKYEITLEKSGAELFGSHPLHGSTNGKNFWVNIQKNVWFCFRCGSGGGAILLVAVLEEIIDCQEAKKGGLTDSKFIKTAQIIKEKFGINILKNKSSLADKNKIDSIINSIKQISPEISKLKIANNLDPILRELSKIDETQAEAILSENIKKHFKFTNKEIEVYSRKLKQLRKEELQKAHERKSSLTKSEILNLLEREKDIVSIHPAIDFKKGVMSFGVLIQDKLAIVTSERQIILVNKGDLNE